MCVGGDSQIAKRGVKEETEKTKVLPGSGPGCKLGRPRMKSVTSRHRAKLPSAWKGRLLRNEGDHVTYLRCSASSSGGRVGSSHLLCELRIVLVNCHAFDFSCVVFSSVGSILPLCLNPTLRLMSFSRHQLEGLRWGKAEAERAVKWAVSRAGYVHPSLRCVALLC
jgi:hypothetical protein